VSLKPEQYEVKPPAGSIEPSRFYIIEPLATETGYSVQVRRVGDKKVVWRCSTTFETSAPMHDVYGSSLEKMIELAKYDLDRGLDQMSELFLDFSEVADLETIRQRLLSLFQNSPHEVRYLEVTFHEKGVAGAAGHAKHRHMCQGDDVSGLARVVAESIVGYANGKDGRLYRGATVVILRG